MQHAYENIFREQKIQKKVSQEHLALAEQLEKATVGSKITSWLGEGLQMTTTTMGILAIGLAIAGGGGLVAGIAAFAFSGASIGSGVTTAFEAKYQREIGQFNSKMTGLKEEREAIRRNIHSSHEVAGNTNNYLADSYKMQKQVQEAASKAGRM